MKTTQQQDYKIVDNFVITPVTLGRGAFGTVKRGYHQDQPQNIVAAKVMSIDYYNKNKNFVKLLKRELDILPKLENPHIVKLYHASRTKNNFYMFLEYCNGGDLKVLLSQRGGILSEAEAVKYFKHIVWGFKGIYQQNVIHRDIKPANILIHDGQAKISDFGFARVVEDMENVDQFTLLGTPLYMSPQILGGEKFSAKCDIWSLGMVFYELLYGVTPWTAQSQAALLQLIKQKPLNFPETPKRSTSVKEILQRMLVINEEQRISWYELFDLDLVKSDDKKLKEELQNISSESDSLERSAKLNQLYLEKNRVMENNNDADVQNVFEANVQVDQNDLSNQGSQNNESASKNIFNQSEAMKNLNYPQIVQEQDKIIARQYAVLRIDAYLGFKRNVVVFVNVTTNAIFKLFKDANLKIAHHLFYRTIFVLQKNQMVHFKGLQDIMASKIPIGQGFNQDDWKIYKNTQQYFSTLKAIKSDVNFIKPYFTELYARAKDQLNQCKNSLSLDDQREINEFTLILNDDFVKDNMAFYDIYEKTLKKVLRIFAQQILSESSLQNNRLVLQTFKYLHICLDPFKFFNWNEYQPFQEKNNQKTKEFNQFYENYELMEINNLKNDIQNDLSIYKQ